MEKAQEILFHIEELYTQNPKRENVLHLCEENPVRYQAWVDAFKEYDLTDVLLAIDSFWEFKNSKSKPNVAQIKAILNTRNVEKSFNAAAPEVEIVSPAEDLMARDVELKRNRHLLTVYKQAVAYITQDLLLEKIPSSEWRKLSFSMRYALANKYGLFENFDEVLVTVCRQNYGKDYQFASESMIEAESRRNRYNVEDGAKYLANHWRV